MNADELSEILYKNSKRFCQEGLKYLFNAVETKDGIEFAVVFIQTSIELLTKYQLLQVNGISSILQKNITKDMFLNMNTSDDVKTKGYEECKKEILKNISPEYNAKEILGCFQGLRNNIVHVGYNNNSNDVQSIATATTATIVHGLSSLLSLNKDHEGIRVNALKDFIGRGLFEKLICLESYITEALKKIPDKTAHIGICPICANNSCKISFHEYFCYICGFGDNRESSHYTSCPECNKKNTFLYDKLNPTAQRAYHGKCMSCGSTDELIICDTCCEEYFLVYNGYPSREEITEYYKLNNKKICPRCLSEHIFHKDKK